MSIVNYLKSKPRNIQATPMNGQVDSDFRLFVSQYTPSDPTKIYTDHLGEDISSDARKLYVKYFGLLFHRVYSLFSEPTFGSGNYQMMRLLRDGGTYTLQMWSMQQGLREYKFNDARVSFNGERMTISSNNGYSISVVRTREPFDANRWADPANPNVVDTYKLTLLKYDDVKERMYCVDLDM